MSVGSGTVRLSHQNRNVAGTPLDEGVGNTLVSDLWFKHLDAAAQLQYARITKTAVLCAGRFWPEPESGGYSVRTNLASDFCFDSTFGQKGAKRILCSYAVGDQAVDIASSPQDKLKYWIVEDVANANGLNWSANYSKTIALDRLLEAPTPSGPMVHRPQRASQTIRSRLFRGRAHRRLAGFHGRRRSNRLRRREGCAERLNYL